MSAFDLAALIGVGGLVCVVDDCGIVLCEDFDVCFLDEGEGAAVEVGEHGCAGTGRTLGTSIHSQRDVLMLLQRLKLRSGLEAIVTSSSHSQPRVTRRRDIIILLN